MVTWNLTIDANDPERLAQFWAPLLGYEPQPPPAGHGSWRDWYLSVGVPEEELADIGPDYCDRLHDPTGEGPTIWFQIVPEGKTVTKNRLHLDVYPAGPDRTRPPTEERKRAVQETIDRVVQQGATVLRTTIDDNSYSAVMQDPEGNEFCIS
ncbi:MULTISPECIES: VOC family protein [unclassified Nocardioides]|uniref:VOC family protein n=1 Tax=unclassified Nocardioides TaxID=2615069 RepID=UPI003620ABE7